MKYCPECGASLAKYMGGREPEKPKPEKPASYDQDAVWRRMVEEAENLALPPPTEDVVEAALSNFKFGPSWPASAIVHLLFDRSVTPAGGILHSAVLSEGRMKVTPKMLASAGYVVEDEKVVLKDGVPVGKFCRVLDYWAGENQYERWSMAEPVDYSPSRNGAPFFMDERMVAFGVTFGPPGYEIQDAFKELLSLCESFGQECIGKAMVMRLAKY